MKNWNWWVTYKWDHEQHILIFEPLYITDDGCKIIHYLWTHQTSQKLFKQMKTSETPFNLFISNKTFKPKTEKLGQRNISQRDTETQNSILMLCRYSWRHVVLSAHVRVLQRLLEIPWSLRSLQRRSLHGDHYSRFHMLNKRNCRKNSLKFKWCMCIIQM